MAVVAVFAFVAGAWAQYGGWPTDVDPNAAVRADLRAEEDGAQDQTRHDFFPREEQHVSLGAVRDPERTLTNLALYSNGRDVGRIRSVEVDQAGAPARVEIAFNDGESAVWVAANAIAYDAAHHRVVTALDPGKMKALEATRFH